MAEAVPLLDGSMKSGDHSDTKLFVMDSMSGSFSAASPGVPQSPAASVVGSSISDKVSVV